MTGESDPKDSMSKTWASNPKPTCLDHPHYPVILLYRPFRLKVLFSKCTTVLELVPIVPFPAEGTRLELVTVLPASGFKADRFPFAYLPFKSSKRLSASDGTRTHTSSRTPDPKSGAYTNFATNASVRALPSHWSDPLLGVFTEKQFHIVFSSRHHVFDILSRENLHKLYQH